MDKLFKNGTEYIGKKVFYNGKEYFFREYVIKCLEEIGVRCDEDCVKYLLRYKNPYHNLDMTEIAQLSRSYYENRKIFGDGPEALGKIVQCNLYGDVIAEYDDVISLVEKCTNPKGFFYFSRLGNTRLRDTGKVDFYGLKIKAKSRATNDGFDANQDLHKYIRNIFAWRDGVRAPREYADPYFNKWLEGVSFEEFKKQKVRHLAFTYGEWFGLAQAQFSESKEKKEEKILGWDTGVALEYLMYNAYGHNDETLVKSVMDLNYHNKPGIYILYLKERDKYYVGQTSIGISKRIIEHFSKPNSQFDESLLPGDITDIYVLHTDKYLNEIEQDCIAILGEKNVLNVFAGGDSIIMVNSKNYYREFFRIDSKKFKAVLDYLKQYNKQ